MSLDRVQIGARTYDSHKLLIDVPVATFAAMSSEADRRPEVAPIGSDEASDHRGDGPSDGPVIVVIAVAVVIVAVIVLFL